MKDVAAGDGIQVAQTYIDYWFIQGYNNILVHGKLPAKLSFKEAVCGRGFRAGGGFFSLGYL